MNMENIDFVYLIKPGDSGKELKYSLRSISKYYPNNKIWIVGYKPTDIININYLPIKEENKKWKNLVNDLIETCKCEEISENFIYMNDDFFCINPTISLDDIVFSNMGLLDIRTQRYKNTKKHLNGWQKAFANTYDLLEKLKVKKPYYDYEPHLPLLINKEKFLEVMSLPEVKEFLNTNKVLHYRSLYRNYDKIETNISFDKDCKILGKKDTSNEKIKICGWLSTADGLINNPNFPYLNKLLRQYLSEPCEYEKVKEKPVHKKDKYMNY